jgi:hypothetical protein
MVRRDAARLRCRIPPSLSTNRGRPALAEIAPDVVADIHCTGCRSAGAVCRSWKNAPDSITGVKRRGELTVSLCLECLRLCPAHTEVPDSNADPQNRHADCRHHNTRLIEIEATKPIIAVNVITRFASRHCIEGHANSQ